MEHYVYFFSYKTNVYVTRHLIRSLEYWSAFGMNSEENSDVIQFLGSLTIIYGSYGSNHQDWLALVVGMGNLRFVYFKV